MESYLGKKSQKENPEDKKDDNVKSDSESEPDSSCTATAAKLLCANNNTIQQMQDSEEGGPSTSEMINPCSHLIKSTENTTEILAVIPVVLKFKDVAYLKFSNNLPIISN